MKLTVNGEEYTLGEIGFMVRVNAEKHIRKQRQEDFREALRDVAGMGFDNSNPIITQAFTTLLRSTVVNKYDVDMWMMSESGAVFMLGESLNKNREEKLSQEHIEEIYNSMTMQQINEVDVFLHECLNPSVPSSEEGDSEESE